MTNFGLLTLAGILSMSVNVCSLNSSSRNAPVPGTPKPDSAPKLLTSFIPLSMHVLHHCIESIQYEPVIPSTTAKPATTTAAAPQRPTTLHKPGYFGPQKPPPTPFPSSTGITSSTTNQQQTTEPSTETAETLLWNDKQFFEWFLQSKYKQIKLDNEYNLQLLDPLPQRLLEDIEGERYELPALLDEDNVNEFRKIYDDKYRESETDVQQMSVAVGNKPQQMDNRVNSGVGGTPTGGAKKRVPPTKPYLRMLLLYDLLKREALKSMFAMYEGYSQKSLSEVVQFKADNGQQQLLFVLLRMLEEKNIDKADVVSRTKAMITDLENPRSQISEALVYVPPLVFAP